MNEAIETTPVENSESQETAPVGFLDSLPEDLRADPSLRNFTDAAGLAKSYVHAQRMIGAEKIALPGKAATEDDWRPVWSKLGAPDSADGYQIAGEGFGEQELQSFKEQAYAAGLTGQQAQSMANFLEREAQGSSEAADADMTRISEEYDAELRAEFGAAYEQKHDRAAAAGRAMGIDPQIFDDIRLDNGLPLGDHPFIIRLFAGLADQLGEDTLEGATTELVKTPDQAAREIADLTAPNSPYWDKNHPAHETTVQDVLRLREYQFPEPQEG
ncbi:hypothetical protein N9E91_04260 [Alphaproteobacteria bacterium]|nr:hypothetical protein [Alphaproteobacteria bacterium]